MVKIMYGPLPLNHINLMICIKIFGGGKKNGLDILGGPFAAFAVNYMLVMRKTPLAGIK